MLTVIINANGVPLLMREGEREIGRTGEVINKDIVK
jgi:hypothetical protein